MKSTLAIALAAFALSGCADKLLSDDRIKDSTAMVLGQPVMSISDRHYDGFTNTSYEAKTTRGTYHCLINGGSVMAFGMTNPPSCARI